MRRLLLLATLLLLLPAQAHAAPAPAFDVSAWREGLATLRRELPNRHPAPFLNVSRVRWDSAGADLEQRLPTLTRNQAMVGLMQLVAMLGDAHTVLAPDSALGLRYYGLELYAFEDGLFIRRADTPHAALVGAKILRIGGISADQALARVATVIPHENDWWVRAWGPLELTIPEVLEGLGIARDVERLKLVLERNGRVDSVFVSPAGRIADQHVNGPDPIDRAGWATMRTKPMPLWERRPDEAMWWTFADGTLYVCQRAVQPSPQAATNRRDWDAVFALADSVRPARLVIDVRENSGGNGALNRYPVQQVLRRPELDRRDKLFVITGARTFSAGQQFVNLLEAWTQATLVGEPTGQRPSQYGDHRPLPLPGIGMTAQISTVYHQAPNEFDTRLFVAPRIYMPLDSRSYIQGIDPAMTAILAPAPEASLVDTIEHAIAQGDSAGAERALTAARERTANRFRNFEGDVNALGYRLLAAGQGAQAVQALALNTRAYPRSANAFDSYGEALLAAGRRDEAIAAYRHAVELVPNFPPSIQALGRLGVHQ